MPAASTQLEGTWEEILGHTGELAGKRVRVTVLGQGAGGTKATRLRRENREMLALLDEWEKTPLPEEEKQALDEFEEFRKAHPFSLRSMIEEP